MDNPVCKKVISMLSLYIEDKLTEDEKSFVDNHFLQCADCYNKYLEMKEIINNLHFEYEKMITEFERLEANKMFNIREYETFYKNISPYIDDELCYDESIRFRKYLLKSKPARAELANAYGLKNNIKNSVNTYKDNLNVNFSKKIIGKLKQENHDSFDNIYKRAIAVFGFFIVTLIGISAYAGFNYFDKAQEPAAPVQSVNMPDDDEFVEFTFDENKEALLTAK